MATGTEVRMDTRGLVVILPADVHRALKIAAAEDDTSLQRLVLELIVDFLERRALDRAA